MAKEADVAKHLSFEDVSMHSPGVFSRFEAQLAREQPTVANLRRVLSEVGKATEHHQRILSSAADKADGLSDADLKRLKYSVTNLKGGVLELGAQARFVDAVNENLSPEEVYAQFDGEQLSEEVKKQKAEIDALRAEVEAEISALAEEVSLFDAEFARTSAQLEAAEAAERAAACPGGLAPLSEEAADGEALEVARAALEAADADLALAQAAVAARRREAAEAERSLGPDEAALAATLAQIEALEDAAGAGAKGAHLALQSESAAQYTSELCALLRGLSGVELVSARADALHLRMASHTLSLRLAPGSTALADASLAPPTVAVDDIARASRRVDVVVREVQARLAQAGHEC